jgi:hypothetical protein
MGGNQEGFITDRACELDTKGVNQELDEKIKHHQGTQPNIRHAVAFRKNNEKKRRQVINDSLDNIACITGVPGVAVTELNTIPL